METLNSYSTKELLEELKQREGVHTEYAEPHQDKKISVRSISMIGMWLWSICNSS